MPAYFQPDDILARLYGWLNPWVVNQGGQVSIATDPWHFLELMTASPAGFLCALHWNGDHNMNDEPAQAGTFLDNSIEVGISTNLGLTVKPGSDLIIPRTGPTPAGRPPLLRLVGTVRDHVRRLQFPSGTTGEVLTLRNTAPVTMPGPQGNIVLAAYKCTFSLWTSPPPIQWVNPELVRPTTLAASN